jgi:hypothetical protein
MYTLEMFKADLTDLLTRTRKAYFAAQSSRGYVFGQRIASKYDVQKAFTADLAFILNLAKLNELDIDSIIPPKMQAKITADADKPDNPLADQVAEQMADNT